MQIWDFGRKVFSTASGPHLFAYVGDVLFPSLVLGQIASAADQGLLFPDAVDAEDRFAIVRRKLSHTFNGLPANQRRDFTAVYATRDSEGMESVFSLFALQWSKKEGFVARRVAIPIKSSSLIHFGSGSTLIETWESRWNASSQGNTSRAVFSAFCDAVRSGKDPYSGGPPQLVGLYRKGPGLTLGIVTRTGPHIFGLPIDPASSAVAASAEWRNELFERVGADGTLLVDAQPHRVPKGLGK